MQNRRKFITNLGMLALGAAVVPATDLFGKATEEPWFKISLAEWSLHRTLRSGKLKNLDFPEFVVKEFGIYAVEYVNQFFKDKAKDQAYLSELKKRSEAAGVTNVLIMIDGEGNLGDRDNTKRQQAVENHYKWIDAAHYLGCKAIRVNAQGEGSRNEVKGRVVKSLSALADYGKKGSINVIVENHGGISSDGIWLSDVLASVGKENCGSLPDFGNFYEYDRYQGVTDLMPFAKGVSAKSHQFDEKGNEVDIDYDKMMQIVKKSGYKGFVGIEYEGDKLSEVDGILATKKLLERYQ